MNILTIDFDWVMRDTIECYNSYISDPPLVTSLDPKEHLLQQMDVSVFRKKVWETIKIHMPTIDFQLNTKLLEQLTSICMLYSNKLYKIENHHEIVPFITKPIETLINIDHHHDCYPKKTDTYMCANWVTYLYNHQLFNKYLWIANDTSWLDMPAIDNFTVVQTDTPLLHILSYNIEQVFICQSPEWLPPKVNQYYKEWIKQFKFNNK